MIQLWQRSLATGSIVAAVITTGVLGLAVPASAAPVETGTLTMESDPGDWIGLGMSYSFSSEENDLFNATASTQGNFIQAGVDGASGDGFSLEFAAPSGQTLAPGTYKGAQRYPFNPPQMPGMDISGNGRGCNQLIGDFTVNAVEFGPSGYLVRFDVTFEQHCEFGEPALRGHLVISNPPPPAPLTLAASVSPNGTVSTVSGNATITGTMACNKDVFVRVQGSLTQIVKKEIVRGSFYTEFTCTAGATVTWAATAVPAELKPFVRGDAEAIANSWAQDPFYGNTVNTSNTQIVNLRK